MQYKYIWLTIEYYDEGNSNSIIGAFDTEQQAKDACIDKYSYIAPLALNQYYPSENKKAWYGAYYPLTETQEEADLRIKNLIEKGKIRSHNMKYPLPEE